jgi:biotin carboxyl carrier protein
MKKIKVLKSFVLTLRNEVKKFEVGVHEVEENIAAHWYVRAHSEPVAEPAAEEAPAAAPAPAAEPTQVSAPAAAEAEAKKSNSKK